VEGDATAKILQRFPDRDPLTLREREVLARIAVGKTNKETARQLGLSLRTVEGYRARIMKKLGARNATELVRRIFDQSP
jgi:DNA-binding CsgD family transcriptional regulator